MTYTTVEIIAAVFVLATLAKAVMMFKKQKNWLAITEKIYDNPNNSRVAIGILAILVLYLLLQELTIVEVFAVFAFASMVVAYELLEYPKEAMHIAKKAIKNKRSPGMTYFLLVWIALCVWALIILFF